MVKPDHPPANAFVAAARKIYNPIGFSKGYNFVLFFIFAGALMGFTLARFPYLNLHGVFCASPGVGECYWYTRGITKVGILLHLATIIPASFLVCFQFVPVIRHRWLLFHRINGYVVLVLSVVGIVGAFLVARHAFGGEIETQLATGVIGILIVACLALAYINVKRLQLEQHRAWMLRAWFYAACIITQRFILIAIASIIGSKDEYYQARLCAQIDYTIGEAETREQYPSCDVFYSGQDPNKQVLVLASMGDEGDSMNAGAALGLSFGAAIWLAFTLHAIGIEIYLHLTPFEHERLRNVSYQRQQEAGMKNPGRAGLTADRLGDAQLWKPACDARQDNGSPKGSTASATAIITSPDPELISI